MIQGMETIKKVEEVETRKDRPVQEVMVVDCGEVEEKIEVD